MALTVDLLGPTQVAIDGVVVSGGGPRERGVLAALALQHCGVLTAEQLLDRVWPDGGGTRGTLHVHVHNLRDRLGPHADHLVRTQAGYRLDGPQLSVDTDRLAERALVVAQAASTGDTVAVVEHARAAEALFRGELCEDLPDLDVTAERNAYAEQRLALVEQRIEAELTGPRVECIPELEALVLRHPYRERLWGLLMVALYRDQRQAESLGAYRRAREALLEGVGVEPGEQLQAIEKAVLAHEDPAALLSAAAEPTGPSLLWLDTQGRPRRQSLPATGALLIGRLDDADVRLDADPTVSRRHAALTRVNHGWELRDLESLNGTVLNGALVTQPVGVEPGDLIRCGSTLLLLATAGRPVGPMSKTDRATQRLRPGPPLPLPRPPASNQQAEDR